MPIVPLPQFEADLAQLEEEDRKVYEALKAPKTIVVRFGCMKLVGEFPSEGSIKPGCGSKLVCRTHRGVEMCEMLTSTCPNSGCSKSVSRKDMLGYIENSGGRDYPFFTEGRVLRLATPEDIDAQNAIEQSKHGLKMVARRRVEELDLRMKIVDAEPLLGGERVTFYYSSEDRVDFRELIRLLSNDVRTRADLRQVGARDEARLTADYEKCGQYCCCKNFLKVLKPISMKSAKVQKATLDPLKISGRCGRLMCCLRYEDQTYEDLKKNLPRKKSRVGTPDGDGTVIDGQILTQLVLVRLDGLDKDGKFRDVAVPVENLEAPKSLTPPPAPIIPAPGEMRAGGRDFGPRRDSGPRDTSPRQTGPHQPGSVQTGSVQTGSVQTGPREGAPRRPEPRGPGPRSGADRPGAPRPPAPQRPQERRQPPPLAPAPMPPPARTTPPPPEPTDDFDDIETDFGDEPARGNPSPGGASSGPGGVAGAQDDETRRRRRRRRRRRGGSGGGGPGGAGGAGGTPASGA